MNLHETEETLRALIKRHVGLDEETLVTLLLAGGWEEKKVQEAKVIFRTIENPSGSVAKNVALTPLQEEPVFIPPVDSDHFLTPPETTRDESDHGVPQSLVVEPQKELTRREDLPHNLPLRPFETSEHIWPFSRYKDVFYGDMEEPVSTKPVQKKSRQYVEEVAKSPTFVVIQAPTVIPPPVVVEPPPKPQPQAAVQQVPKPSVVSVPVHVPTNTQTSPPTSLTTQAPVHKGDERLVMMASIMLFIILALLWYMYSNGRI